MTKFDGEKWTFPTDREQQRSTKKQSKTTRAGFAVAFPFLSFLPSCNEQSIPIFGFDKL